MPSTPALQAATAAVASATALAEVAWEEVEGAELLGIAAALGRLKALTDGALVALAGRLVATDAPGTAG